MMVAKKINRVSKRRPAARHAAPLEPAHRRRQSDRDDDREEQQQDGGDHLLQEPEQHHGGAGGERQAQPGGEDGAPSGEGRRFHSVFP